ncbi:hypothetical protein WDZ92_43780, partial [Nostoc sp. NIES-2111]
MADGYPSVLRQQLDGSSLLIRTVLAGSREPDLVREAADAVCELDPSARPQADDWAYRVIKAEAPCRGLLRLSSGLVARLRDGGPLIDARGEAALCVRLLSAPCEDRATAAAVARRIWPLILRESRCVMSLREPPARSHAGSASTGPEGTDRGSPEDRLQPFSVELNRSMIGAAIVGSGCVFRAGDEPWLLGSFASAGSAALPDVRRTPGSSGADRAGGGPRTAARGGSGADEAGAAGEGIICREIFAGQSSRGRDLGKGYEKAIGKPLPLAPVPPLDKLA